MPVVVVVPSGVVASSPYGSARIVISSPALAVETVPVSTEVAQQVTTDFDAVIEVVTTTTGTAVTTAVRSEVVVIEPYGLDARTATRRVSPTTLLRTL